MLLLLLSVSTTDLRYSIRLQVSHWQANAHVGICHETVH